MMQADQDRLRRSRIHNIEKSITQLVSRFALEICNVWRFVVNATKTHMLYWRPRCNRRISHFSAGTELLCTAGHHIHPYLRPRCACNAASCVREILCTPSKALPGRRPSIFARTYLNFLGADAERKASRYERSLH